MTELTNIEADIAILGMPFSSAYSAHAFTNDQSRAPQYLRDMSDRIVRHQIIMILILMGHYPRKDIKFVDCGDVIPDLSKPLGSTISVQLRQFDSY